MQSLRSTVPRSRTVAGLRSTAGSPLLPRSPCLSIPAQTARYQSSHTRSQLVFRTRPSLGGKQMTARQLQPLFVRHRHGIPFTGSFTQNAKILYSHYPLAVSLASIIILGGLGTLVWFNYYYYAYFVPAYHNFPEAVAKQLRRALYYTNIDLQPQKAYQYYQKAMEAAREERMDPYSEEVIGIKLQIADLQEKSNNPRGAIRLLEAIRSDLLSKSEEALTLEELTPTQQEQRRTRLLARTIGIALKLGELYSSPYISADTQAQSILLWAVNTALRESQSRSAANATTESHGAWLSPDELGATLEGLAHKYEEANAHFLAAPLFLQALAAKSKTDCHSVVLMNNLSISLAQQKPTSEPGMPPPSREALVQSGREWAVKALRVAGKIEPPERDAECDVGCAVAVHNLGEFAEMLGDRVEAGRRYKEAASLARVSGFGEGVARAEEGLRRVRAKDAVVN